MKYFSAVVIILASFFLPSKVVAAELNAPSTKDTYILPGVTGNQGQETTLKLEFTNDYRSYLFQQFDLSALPSGAAITKATLKMYVEQAGATSCYVQVQRQPSSWNENAGYLELGYESTIKVYATEFVQNSGVYQWNITELVQEWLGGTYPNHGLVMHASDDCLHSFSSRQSGTVDWRPVIVVTFTAPPTATPTPTPTKTPTPTLRLSPSPTPRVSPTLQPTIFSSPTAFPTTSVSTPTPTPKDNHQIGGFTAFFSGSGGLTKGLLIALVFIALTAAGGFIFLKLNQPQPYLPLPTDTNSQNPSPDTDPPATSKSPHQIKTPQEVDPHPKAYKGTIDMSPSGESSDGDE